MDDSDHLCPICCEELDISDQQFYPCKCGYQVCMWCWHRIRESESGLCPACRTPYGDDPHAFSAVDVEEVLKANKEKAAAEKQKKDDVDRTLLANMRVIRRNLVYAVGLPPLSEELLRKPEYFGQYGKINKIVMNRNTTGVRASASAYVTFFHKEDTLACILALDGFTLDGRNIRASYGTSKYCSAFIKNVRCNNPECTYLHSMGEQEDTFTKQEIQAGYVTSGRDVLARQQQIMAQALSGSGPRRKVGGGGPSGTGKASMGSVFPPPTYDEPPKPSSLVPAPITRSTSTPATSGFAAAAAAPAPAPKATRSSSVVSTSPSSSMAATLSAPPPKIPSIAPLSATRKSISGPPTATAASVVAGVHSVNNTVAAPEPRTTLTPLTPLKRTSQIKAKNGSSSLVGDGPPKMPSLRSSQPKPIGRIGGVIGVGTGISSKLSDLGGTKTEPIGNGGSGAIGGAVIRGPPLVSLGGAPLGTTAGPRPVGITALNGGPSEGLGSLGGDIFTGESKSTSVIGGAMIGGAPIGASLHRNPLGGSPISGGSNGFGAIGSQVSTSNSQTSALASMLGISLPTGSGSLNEPSRTSLWAGSQQVIGPAPSVIGPKAGHIGSAIGSYGFSGSAGVIGSNNGPSRSNGPIGGGSIGGSAIGGGVIGGTTIGGGSGAIGGVAIGGGAIGGGAKNDIALLQTLLPGVHITSGQQQNEPSKNNFGWTGQNQNRSNWTVQNEQKQQNQSNIW